MVARAMWLNIWRFGMLGTWASSKMINTIREVLPPVVPGPTWWRPSPGKSCLRWPRPMHRYGSIRNPFLVPWRHTKPGRIWMCSPTPVHFQSVCYQSFSKHSSSTFGLEDFLGGGNFKCVDSSWVRCPSWDVLPWLVDILKEGCGSTFWHWSIFLPDGGISLDLIWLLSMLRSIASTHPCTCACFYAASLHYWFLIRFFWDQGRCPDCN